MTSSTLFLISSLGSPRFSSPKAMSLSTENMNIWFSGFWKSSPTFWASSPIFVLSTVTPSMVIPPRYSPGYMWGMSPFMHLRRVDLPQPLCPARTVTVPSSISRSNFSTAHLSVSM